MSELRANIKTSVKLDSTRLLKNVPLQCEIENKQLVIRIGIGTLAFCMLHDDTWLDKDGNPTIKITDELQLAKDVIDALELEDEAGNSRLTRLLDQCLLSAYEEGSTALDTLYTSSI